MSRIVVLVAIVALIGGCGGVPGQAQTVVPSQDATAPTPSATASLRPTTAPSPTPTPTASFAPFGTLPKAALDVTKAARLQAAIDAAVSSGAPDAIAAVITPDGTWAGAAGIDGPDGRAASANDEFYLGSVTQMFTSALILRLAEQRRMDLDAPLASYLGDLSVDTNGATVRQALAMRSGMADYGPDAAGAIQADADHAFRLEEILTHFRPATSAPGTSYVRAGPNYVLLAVAAEHATGMTFAEALRAEVLDPVGASRILQQGHGVVTPKPWALPIEGHVAPFKPDDFGRDGVISVTSSVTFSFGSGSMASDAPSLAAWTWHLVAGDIVDAASLDAMLPSTADGHGLGLERLAGLDPYVAFGQTGGKTGYGSMVVVVPYEQAVVALFVNEPEFIVEPTVRALLDAALGS